MNKDMSAPDQFRAAARLINRALLLLDVKQENCGCCGQVSFTNYPHAKAYEKFCNLPDRLVAAADELDGKKKETK